MRLWGPHLYSDEDWEIIERLYPRKMAGLRVVRVSPENTPVRNTWFHRFLNRWII